MATLERSVFINAPLDDIDVYTLDASRWPEWYVGIEQAAPDGVFPDPGGVVQVVYRAAGVNFNLTMTSTEHIVGESLTIQMEGMITGMNRWLYAAEGDGTWVTSIFEYEIPGGGLGQALDKLVLERMNTEYLESSLSNLKALVEG